MLLTFIELDGFREDWSRLGLDSDDLLVLQLAIMRAPALPPVIPGTGALRKIRFKPLHWNVGKSGACRVCYVHFPEHETVLFVIAYGKSERDNLTAAEKSAVRELIHRQKAAFARRAAKEGKR